MSWNNEYEESEVINDWTRPLKKIWDNLMPVSYPYILEFETKKVVEVKQKKYIGPYSHTEHFIDYDCYLKVDNKPLIDVGWDGGKITKKLVDEAYGEMYFHDMREKMRELSKFAGLRFSNFDMGGNLNTTVDYL